MTSAEILNFTPNGHYDAIRIDVIINGREHVSYAIVGRAVSSQYDAL